MNVKNKLYITRITCVERERDMSNFSQTFMISIPIAYVLTKSILSKLIEMEVNKIKFIYMQSESLTTVIIPVSCHPC